jgi:flavin reductase (DIM6/NTAB) family NADH-FMN oxidoreductase RutF
MMRKQLMPSPVDDFKAAFRGHPAGVTLVVGTTEQGPAGVTVSSIASISATPPLISFSVSKARTSTGHLISSPQLRVLLLGEHQARVATSFATSGAPRFTSDQGWVATSDPLPVLENTPAVLHAHPVQVVPAGESWLVVAQVDRVEFGPSASPLLYHNQAYHSLGQALHR